MILKYYEIRKTSGRFMLRKMKSLSIFICLFLLMSWQIFSEWIFAESVIKLTKSIYLSNNIHKLSITTKANNKSWYQFEYTSIVSSLQSFWTSCLSSVYTWLLWLSINTYIANNYYTTNNLFRSIDFLFANKIRSQYWILHNWAKIPNSPIQMRQQPLNV